MTVCNILKKQMKRLEIKVHSHVKGCLPLG